MHNNLKFTILSLLLALPLALLAQRDDNMFSGNETRMVWVYRWVSPVVGDFVSFPENHATKAQMESWGYRTRTFQYSAWLDRPNGKNVVAVYRWTMPHCNEFILLGEHEHTDAELQSWGYKDKTFVFYAYRIPPGDDFVAVNRWVNALPQGNTCRDYTLSVLETEFTDEQLTQWGYSGKKVQFYVRLD